ncbi:hypothetical protein [Spiroplasma chrysopicola]|uniref:Transmembrane protein n=1 Tax=Spiroplasma chrysopicola DF-1 TaxID=1276227 RepID=R4UBV0_9MOLU|nr:hypothetical protein [Spiroplasma chrysopicola]AGM25399.1 hypothetical protein SCHRY_v1c08230 [Spiroplasma chrysopicola DF-1]
MLVKRLLASLLNMILCWLNFILWFFNITPIGCMLLGTECPSDQKGKLIFGLTSLLQWILMATVIGTIFIIILWAQDKPSIATRLAKMA